MRDKPNYGLDAPSIIKKWGAIGVVSLAVAIALSIYLPSHWLIYIVNTVIYCVAFFFLMPAITITMGSLWFKFRDRDWLFEQLALIGNEVVLDAGCGHGLLLIGAAKRLTTGKAHGIDLWVHEDQSSNSHDTTIMNAKIEGVENKIEIHSGDMRKMPFTNGSFDAIMSSWAIHNIYGKAEREKALQEIVRVLKPGGRLAILDIDHAPSYAEFFKNNGISDVQLLGPHYTFGNKTYLVLGKKRLF
jgi:ubiquinone/menaquinone biosynthesis C-methylase UbiE